MAVPPGTDTPLNLRQLCKEIYQVGRGGGGSLTPVVPGAYKLTVPESLCFWVGGDAWRKLRICMLLATYVTHPHCFNNWLRLSIEIIMK